MKKLIVLLCSLFWVGLANADGNIQEEFELVRTGQLRSYEHATNEIQSSAIFNQANHETKALISRYGAYLNNWSGRITRISTSHGGGDVSVKITHTSSTYDNLTEQYDGGLTKTFDGITSSSPVYKQLSVLKEGDLVLFSGKLMPSSPSIWEYSLTERGSLEAPEFVIRFDSIQSYSNGTYVVPTMTKKRIVSR
jgi:hypothetical protein